MTPNPEIFIAQEEEKDCLNQLYGRELTTAEAEEAIRNLCDYFKLLISADKTENKNQPKP